MRNLELYDLISSFKRAVTTEFKKNDILYKEGDIPSGIYCLVKGKIKILKYDSNKRKRIVHLASKGEILGIHAVVNNHPYTSTAVAIDRGQATYLKAKNFIKLIESDNSNKFLVMKSLCSSIDLMELHMSMINDRQSGQRFAQILLQLINKYGLKRRKALKIKLTVEELASFTCMSKGYMKKILLDFTAKGILRYQSGEITILDKLLLEKTAKKIK